MALLSRLFGKPAAKSGAQTADLDRSRNLVGRAGVVSQADQDATRARMEAEMATQRQQREDAAKADA